MTRTSAAIDAALPSDRRAFLGCSVALASALTAAAVPSASGASPAVGPIEAAYAEHVALSRAADTACEAVWLIEEQSDDVPQPLWRHDENAGGYQQRFQDGSWQACISSTEGNLAFLRKIAARQDLGSSSGKARRTLVEIEAWLAEVRRRDERVGLPPAQAAQDRAMEAMLDHAEAMFAMEPTSYRDLAVLAALAYQHGRDDWDKILHKGLMSFAGIVPYWEADRDAAAEGHANVA